VPDAILSDLHLIVLTAPSEVDIIISVFPNEGTETQKISNTLYSFPIVAATNDYRLITA
jgi:hypothetical protein